MRTADYDFDLPEESIAQHPLAGRDQSKLLHLDRTTRQWSHRRFTDLPQMLRAGDVLIFNDSKVIPARLRGINRTTGGHFEILLLEETSLNEWWVMMKPGKRARPGTKIVILSPDRNPSAVHAEVTHINEEGHRLLRFSGVPNVLDVLDALGEPPLPPYIRRADLAWQREDAGRYQTVFACRRGSVAAPTAGLHFSEALLERLRRREVRIGFLTLHVGLGTFAPVKADSIEGHVMHRERFDLSRETVDLIQSARRDRRRVVAVGTTTLRVLESVAAQHRGELQAGSGTTAIFIHPPYVFRAVDALVTNFHLPRSTLLMLVSAFAAPGELDGREWMLRAYAEAVKKRYRFFSYGDAMLIT